MPKFLSSTLKGDLYKIVTKKLTNMLITEYSIINRTTKEMPSANKSISMYFFMKKLISGYRSVEIQPALKIEKIDKTSFTRPRLYPYNNDIIVTMITKISKLFMLLIRLNIIPNLF